MILCSSGRDRVLILWNLSSGSSIRVLPVYEEIEDTFIIPKNMLLPFYNKDENAIHVAAAGEKGAIIHFSIFIWIKLIFVNFFVKNIYILFSYSKILFFFI